MHLHKDRDALRLLCIEAAAAGKHIFSQKPFAYNIEEGRNIIRAVDEAGVKLTPSFMHSYMDGSIAARRIVEEGKIGEIRHIRMRNATKNPFDSAARLRRLYDGHAATDGA